MIYVKKPDGKEYFVEWIPFGLWWRTLVSPVINGVKVKEYCYKQNEGVFHKLWEKLNK